MFDKKLWEFTTLIAAHAPHMWQGKAIVVDHALYYFWKHHRQIVHQYLQQFSSLHQDLQSDKETNFLKGEIICEIFHLEMMVRVFCAALVRIDFQKKQNHTEAVARSVFAGQLRLKNESLKSLMELTNTDPRHAVKLNDLRKYLEHHTDLLLGHIITPCNQWDFCHDPERVKSYRHVDFAEILLINESYSPWDAINQAGQFLDWMESVISSRTETTIEQLKGAILRCFPATAFHEHGTFRPVQQLSENKFRSVM